ncbi:hypothetical protein CDEF62S_03230 [Castellaniella defragrans]
MRSPGSEARAAAGGDAACESVAVMRGHLLSSATCQMLILRRMIKKSLFFSIYMLILPS